MGWGFSNERTLKVDCAPSEAFRRLSEDHFRFVAADAHRFPSSPERRSPEATGIGSSQVNREPPRPTEDRSSETCRWCMNPTEREVPPHIHKFGQKDGIVKLTEVRLRRPADGSLKPYGPLKLMQAILRPRSPSEMTHRLWKATEAILKLTDVISLGQDRRFDKLIK